MGLIGGVMIDLTEKQQQILDQEKTPSVRDPRNNKVYVLLDADLFQKVRDLLSASGDEWGEDTYRASMEVFGREGWNDPSMDVYDALDPRRTP
jgi:hypothetical protein